ncbi:Ulp1 protease family, C-terminal catalytic domain [Dillenia turbinata]|uniref:Ulp1 protease family, C-terminal catalytic domain n=1 Tax=Dillenia turbinata TaxID=194707 RepID=A0AAN8ZG85_9MAGN
MQITRAFNIYDLYSFECSDEEVTTVAERISQFPEKQCDTIQEVLNVEVGSRKPGLDILKPIHNTICCMEEMSTSVLKNCCGSFPRCKRSDRKRKQRKEIFVLPKKSDVSQCRCSDRRPKHKKEIFVLPKKLDTGVFECYLENLWSCIPEDKRASFAYLDSLWFSLYMKESSKQKVLKWIKQKNIFSKKYILVPIVCWSHWSLLIFCHLGESTESKSRTPCMLLLDSLRMADPKRLEPNIRKFVQDIYKTEERPEQKKLISRLPLLLPSVPQQSNANECGNFVLYFIKLFVESAPNDFSISEGYPYFMKEDWFKREGFECFSKKLHRGVGSSKGLDAREMVSNEKVDDEGSGPWMQVKRRPRRNGQGKSLVT